MLIIFIILFIELFIFNTFLITLNSLNSPMFLFYDTGVNNNIGVDEGMNERMNSNSLLSVPLLFYSLFKDVTVMYKDIS